METRALTSLCSVPNHILQLKSIKKAKYINCQHHFFVCFSYYHGFGS